MPQLSAAELVSFAGDLGEATQLIKPDGDYVVRRGKIFACGDYPDKQFSFDENDLARAIKAFQPAPVDLEHVPTVLDGKLGYVSKVFGKGKDLMGEVHLPRWLDQALGDEPRKVSAQWNRATKQLERLALVRTPRVSDAALMAAFSAEAAQHPETETVVGVNDPLAAALLAEFARHDTPTGQAAIQRIHDATVAGGAVCQKVAMAARHESSAIQQIHDMTTGHGAACEKPGGYSLFSTGANRPGTPTTAPKPVTTLRSTRMSNKIKEWFTAKAREDGVELTDEEIDAAFSSPAPAPVEADIAQLKAAPDSEASKELKELREKVVETFGVKPEPKPEVNPETAALQAQIATLTKENEATAARFAMQEEQNRQLQAAAFAKEQVDGHRLSPPAAEALAPLAAMVARNDQGVTFADGEKSGVVLLQEFIEKLPDLSFLETSQILPKEAMAIFNKETTKGVSGHTGEMTEERRQELLSMTQLGRSTLKDEATNGNGKS